MDKYVLLWIVFTTSIGAINGQDNCMYLNTDWIFEQGDFKAALQNFNLNVNPSTYTIGSTITVNFNSLGRSYKTLFIQAKIRGGFDNTPVGTWGASNSASPIFCQGVGDSLLDVRDNLPGSRTFTWRPPAIAPIDAEEIEFRATIIDDQDTVWFGLTSAPITYVNPCSSSPCLNGANCQVDPTTITYTCLCNNGYTGPTCAVAPSSCNGISCGIGGFCSGGSCTCINGYTGTFCEDAPSSCNGISCGIGGFCSGGSCTCINGYTGTFCEVPPSSCSGIFCQNGGFCSGGSCFCINGYSGTLCEDSPNLCSGIVCQNGGFCLEGSCSCNNGYSGTLCEVSPNLCSDLICQNGGLCSNGICNCVNGYSGTFCEIASSVCNVDGGTCQNGGVCSQNQCFCTGGYSGTYCEIVPQCEGLCMNGGACVAGTCSCPTGWTGTLCDSLDITAPDPCNPNPCLSGGICMQTTTNQNRFVCSCLNGYSGELCQSFTPVACASDTCRNGGTCLDNPLGGYSCTCLPGFEGQNCEVAKAPPCESLPCQNGGLCFAANNDQFFCVCNAPWTGSFCDDSGNICVPNPCGNGQCQPQNGGVSYQCTCTDGTMTSIDQPCPERSMTTLPAQATPSLTTLIPSIGSPMPITNTPMPEPAHPCQSSPCFNGGICLFGEGIYICRCPATHTGERCETQVSSATTPSPVTHTNLCNGSPCQNGGVCQSLSGTVLICMCPGTHTGSFCEIPVSTAPPIDACSSNPCRNEGECIAELSGSTFVCTCKPFFVGDVCQIPVLTIPPTGPCASNPCLNQGVCTATLDAYVCTCTDSFTGDVCENPVTTPASPSSSPSVVNPCTPDNPCMNSGVCNPLDVTEFECTCPDTFTGSLCEITVITPPPPTIPPPLFTTMITPGIPCSPDPCLNGGMCLPSGDTYTCECTGGFTGQHCETVFVTDPCSDDPCANGGICAVTDQGDISCTCAPGFEGTRCETNIDECANDPCENQGTCIDGDNGYECQCMAGYAGIHCEIAQECESYCFNGGICELLTQTRSPLCTCVEGFIGERCHFGPCDSSTCSNGGLCSVMDLGNDEFTYICACTPGFKGDRCSEVITCADDPCQNGATCTESPTSSFTCDCATGFNGRFCQIDINECASNPCPNNGLCIDIPGGYICETGVDFCAQDPPPCDQNNVAACINSRTQMKALCVCKTNFKGRTCDQEVKLQSTAKSRQFQDWPLDPWWIALIGLIVVLFVVFVIIVCCLHFGGNKEDDELRKSNYDIYASNSNDREHNDYDYDSNLLQLE